MEVVGGDDFAVRCGLDVGEGADAAIERGARQVEPRHDTGLVKDAFQRSTPVWQSATYAPRRSVLSPMSAATSVWPMDPSARTASTVVAVSVRHGRRLGAPRPTVL